jgi:hypothetical protein
MESKYKRNNFQQHNGAEAASNGFPLSDMHTYKKLKQLLREDTQQHLLLLLLLLLWLNEIFTFA